MPVRDPNSYEGFTHEDKRYRKLSSAALRTKVRTGIRKGKARVGRRGRLVTAWINYAGSCDLPVLRHYRAARIGNDNRPPDGLPEGSSGYTLQELLRCRKCEACRVSRAWEWANRARDEFDRAANTWLGTITLSPMSHVLMDVRVAKTARRKGLDLREVGPTQLFALRASEIGKELNLWMKRLRKAGRRIRYLCVAEVHTGERRPGTPGSEYSEKGGAHEVGGSLSKDVRAGGSVLGRPHFHLLVHEAMPGDFIRPEEIYVTRNGEVRADDASVPKAEWYWGFTQWKLCGNRDEALYLCSYLKPDASWRIRASQRYGKSSEPAFQLGVPSNNGGDSVVPDAAKRAFGVEGPQSSGETKWTGGEAGRTPKAPHNAEGVRGDLVESVDLQSRLTNQRA